MERARVVQLSAEGAPGKQIAARAGCAEPTGVVTRYTAKTRYQRLSWQTSASARRSRPTLLAGTSS